DRSTTLKTIQPTSSSGATLNRRKLPSPKTREKATPNRAKITPKKTIPAIPSASSISSAVIIVPPTSSVSRPFLAIHPGSLVDPPYLHRAERGVEVDRQVVPCRVPIVAHVL